MGWGLWVSWGNGSKWVQDIFLSKGERGVWKNGDVGRIGRSWGGVVRIRSLGRRMENFSMAKGTMRP